MSLLIQHQFAQCDDEKNIISNKEAVIAVGTSGTGKSSIIKLYCGNGVAIGHETDSKTQESSLFAELQNSNRYWLDSQGANDSTGVDDEKVLKDILKKLYDEKISKIKVIWCVSGDMCKEKQEFKMQANFIKSLGNNIWNSCVIVKKKGRPQPRKLDGVLAAANRYGANITHNNNDRLFGFKALEFGDNKDDELLQEINEQQNVTIRGEKYKRHGYFTNSQIVTYLDQKVAQLSPTLLQFSIQKCAKCGVKGDPRFIYAPCHSELERWHPSSTVPYHSGTLISFHTGSLIRYHSGSPVSHSNYEWFHPGKWDDHVVRNASLHLLTFGIHTIARAIDDSFGDWTCCGSTKTGGGCKQRIVSSSVKFSCCSGSERSSGCQTKYGCCNGAQGSNGCRNEYNCCDASDSNPGCKRKHECCQNNMGSEGCKDRCQSCHRIWGNSNGCTRTTRL